MASWSTTNTDSTNKCIVDLNRQASCKDKHSVIHVSQLLKLWLLFN